MRAGLIVTLVLLLADGAAADEVCTDRVMFEYWIGNLGCIAKLEETRDNLEEVCVMQCNERKGKCWRDCMQDADRIFMEEYNYVFRPCRERVSEAYERDYSLGSER